MEPDPELEKLKKTYPVLYSALRELEEEDDNLNFKYSLISSGKRRILGRQSLRELLELEDEARHERVVINVGDYELGYVSRKVRLARIMQLQNFFQDYILGDVWGQPLRIGETPLKKELFRKKRPVETASEKREEVIVITDDDLKDTFPVVVAPGEDDSSLMVSDGELASVLSD